MAVDASGYSQGQATVSAARGDRPACSARASSAPSAERAKGPGVPGGGGGNKAPHGGEEGGGFVVSRIAEHSHHHLPGPGHPARLPQGPGGIGRELEGAEARHQVKRPARIGQGFHLPHPEIPLGHPLPGDGDQGLGRTHPADPGAPSRRHRAEDAGPATNVRHRHLRVHAEPVQDSLIERNGDAFLDIRPIPGAGAPDLALGVCCAHGCSCASAPVRRQAVPRLTARRDSVAVLPGGVWIQPR